MSQRVKLKKRIYMGFIASALFSLTIILVAFVTFNGTTKDFIDFVAFSKHSQNDMAIIKNISEIQRQALVFTYEGYLSAAEAVHNIHSDMLEQISSVKDRDNRRVGVIERHLNAYFETFQQVEKERQLRTELVNLGFRNAATRVENNIVTYMKQLPGADVSTKKFESQRVLNRLLQVEKNVIRYFDTLDASNISIAKESITEVKRGLDSFLDREEESDSVELLRQTKHSLDTYESIFIEAVQRTRGYLFLVNVVMAAEAYEILYNAKKMIEESNREMETIEDEIISTIYNVTKFLLVTGSVMIILFVFFSYNIVRSITEPVLKLANTFHELTQGSKEAEIPLYELSDEIGSLTKAASVFKEKNRETEELLNKSLMLTKELEKNKAELERSNDELEQFVYTVSHDLKSPLVTSMGFIGIIRKLADQGKMNQAVEKLDRVVKSNERMSQLINDLLELSRVGRIDKDKKPVDLNEMLTTFKDNQQTRLERVGLTLTIKPQLPVIYANESRILQVFENILSNTVKYAVQSDSPFLEIGSKEEEDHYLIYCKDNGPGIPVQYHKKIFGLFYRLGSKQEGTGIGLTVVKKVMNFHNGEVQVESEEGKGATFWLKFPKKKE